MRRHLIHMALSALFLCAPAEGMAGDFSKAMERLNEEDLAGARPYIKEYVADNEGEPEALLLEMRLRFLENQFAEALELLNALRNTDDEALLRRWQGFEDLVQSTWSATQNHKQVPLLDGQVVVHVEAGQDEVLLLYIESAITQARTIYAELLGEPIYPDPLHIHIYGKIETLAAVSSLKVSEIQNSGTIALCKYNRLMITSPRDLLYGYDWLDTLAHEYIHYVISKRNGHSVPIWIHEGLAKFFENRWREENDAVLRPSSQDLLKNALRDKSLIPFDDMSPSMAKLPSQEDTSLAFAEVFTVMDYMKETVGVEGIRKMLDALNDGMSDREAMAHAMNMTFPQFETSWKQWLGKQPLVTLPTKYRSRLYFKNKNQSTDEFEEIGEKQAQDYVYLGDLLRARKRLLAASKEYLKAVAIVGESSPIIQSKVAATLLALEKPGEALEAVEPPLSFHPKYVLLRLYQGTALLALGKAKEAAVALEKAVHLNPFNPEAHERLLEACISIKDERCATRERKAIEILGGSQQRR